MESNDRNVIEIKLVATTIIENPIAIVYHMTSYFFKRNKGNRTLFCVYFVIKCYNIHTLIDILLQFKVVPKMWQHSVSGA